MSDSTSIDDVPRQLGLGADPERQVVGICLRYPQAEVDGLTRADFASPALGRLFDASRLIPATPAPPDVEKPPFDVAIAHGSPMPEAWREWLEQAWEWRPRQAAKLAQVDAAYACNLYDQCGPLGALSRWLGEVVQGAALRRYRSLCAHVVDQIDTGQADADAIKAVLLEMG